MECTICRLSKLPCRECRALKASSNPKEIRRRLTYFKRQVIQKYGNIYSSSFDKPIEVDSTRIFEIFRLPPGQYLRETGVPLSRILHFFDQVIGYDDVYYMDKFTFHNMLCCIMLLKAAIVWPPQDPYTQVYVDKHRISNNARHPGDIFGEFFDRFLDLVKKCAIFKFDEAERNMVLPLFTQDQYRVDVSDNIEQVLRDYDWDTYGSADQRRYDKLIDVYFECKNIVLYFEPDMIMSALSDLPDGVRDMDKMIMKKLLFF